MDDETGREMSEMVADGRGRCVPVRLSAFGAEPTNALMIVTKLHPRSRIRRGVVALTACWSAAVLALFVPFLWRMLVPAFLVDGIVMAMVCGWRRSRVPRVRGTCPRCLTNQQFEVISGVQHSQIMSCPHCHTIVTVGDDEGPTGGERSVT